MHEDILNEHELTKERTPAELLSWVEATIERIGSTDEGEKALRLGKGLVEKLTAEVSPLAIFGVHKFGKSVTVKLKPVLGNQNYDAIVKDLKTDPPSLSYIEITQAHEGENEYLRRLILQRNGVVFPTSDIKKKGTKRTGLEVSTKPKAVEVNEIIHDELGRILDAAKRKEGKDYLPNTSLVIKFSDSHRFLEPTVVAQLDRLVKDDIAKLNLNFTTLFLVGKYRHIFREYDLHK